MFKNWKVSHTLGSLPPHEIAELATLASIHTCWQWIGATGSCPVWGGHLSFILQFITQSPQCKSLILCIKGTITDFEFVTSAYIKLFALNSSDA